MIHDLPMISWSYNSFRSNIQNMKKQRGKKEVVSVASMFLGSKMSNIH